MSIWRNERYDKFEQKSEGDLLRGLPKREFPWKLEEKRHLDRLRDEWQIQVLVLSVEPNPNGRTLDVHFRCIGLCQLPEQRVRQLGFEYDRLKTIASDNLFVFQEVFEAKNSTTLENLELIGKNVLSKFIETVDSKYTQFKKFGLIKEKLRAFEMSPFAVRS